MLTGKTIGVIGAGNMGEALVMGLVRAWIVRPEQILVSDVSRDRLVRFADEFKVRVTGDNRDLVAKADLVILAVKPQVMRDVLEECRRVFHHGQVVISVAAGITTGFIEKWVDNEIPVVRVMPNTPALVGEAVSAYCLGRHGTADQALLASQILSAVGVTVRVEEEMMDAVTALSGTGPAYLFYLLEGLIEAGRNMGLPDHLARALVRQTAFGAAKLVRETTKTPRDLRAQVTSPQGTTHAAMTHLEAVGFKDMLVQAVLKARDRSVELGKPGHEEPKT